MHMRDTDMNTPASIGSPRSKTMRSLATILLVLTIIAALSLPVLAGDFRA